MSDDTTTETPDTAPDQGSPQAAETFSLEYVQQLRSEAARYRQEKKQAAQTAAEQAAAEWQTKLDAAGDENAELNVKVASAELTIEKYKAMIDAGIPTSVMPDVLNLVNGHDPESIAESVASALKLMGHTVREPAVDPYQGSGNTVALNSDALEDSLRRAVGI